MASFVIYVPGVQGANPQLLEAVGLADLSKDRGPEFADCLDGGPDGGRGVIAAWRTGDQSRDPGFAAKAFDWQPAKADTARDLAAGRFWFGVEKDRHVTPGDITRREGIAGYPLTLKDGQVWRIPAAQHLPHRHGLGDDGQYCRQVEADYRDFWQRSEQYAVEFFKALDQLDTLRAARGDVVVDASVSFTLADTWSYCCQALAINYRVMPEIVDFLELLDDAAMRNIVKLTIDLASITEVREQKKTAEFSIAVG